MAMQVLSATIELFLIKGNDFRLVVSINFQQQTCYLIWFGTHVEYDKINVETIAYDTNILNFIKK
ncbi:type II toxin-antitoxin system HigB family toxin [Flavobacterium sp. Arc3]